MFQFDKGQKRRGAEHFGHQSFFKMGRTVERQGAEGLDGEALCFRSIRGK